MAVRGAGVWSLVGSLLVSRAVDSLLMWTMHPFRPALVMRWSHFRAVSNFGLNLSGFGIVNYFARNGDNLIIGHSLGSAALGYYQNAYSLMFYPQQLVTSTVSNVLLSPLARVQDDVDRFRAGTLRIATSMAVVIFPMMLGMMVTADLVVAVALGPKWGAAAPLLAVLAVAGLVQAAVAAAGPVLIAKGRTGMMLKLGIYSACVYFGCFLIGSRWGTMGVAVACVAGSLLQFVALKVFLNAAQLSMWTYWRALLPVLLAGLGMAAVVALWRLGMNALHVTSVPLLTVSSIAIGTASYLGLAMLLCRAVLEDLVNVLGKGFRKGPKP
jgi:PST family polysaccharide transporter